MSPQQAAAVGDIIETQVQHPYPRTLACQINSHATCAHANYLIQSGRWQLHTCPDKALCRICRLFPD